MKISVRGKNNILTKKHIRYAITIFGKHLLSTKLYPNINVLVQNMNIDVWGYCGISDINERKPRSFEILLNPNLSKDEQLSTLAHEMVHLKQLALCEFKSYDNGQYKWHNQNLIMEQDQYEEMPWEIEASTQEKMLMEQYHMQVIKDGMQF